MINPLWPRNILADCLAKSAGRLSLQRGFRCDPEHLRWETRKVKILEDRIEVQHDPLVDIQKTMENHIFNR